MADAGPGRDALPDGDWGGGNVLWSAAPEERAGRPLLLALHGYGSHEGDLFGLVPYLPPELVVASLRAPIPESGGFAWFPRGDGLDSPAATDAAEDAAEMMLSWLDGLPAALSVGLLGFSQGAAMALQLLRHDPARFDYAVPLAGFVLPRALPGDDVLESSRPPVFWGRGDADEVIGAEMVRRVGEWLPAHTTLTERVYPGLAHSISERELADVVGFIGDRIS